MKIWIFSLKIKQNIKQKTIINVKKKKCNKKRMRTLILSKTFKKE